MTVPTEPLVLVKVIVNVELTPILFDIGKDAENILLTLSEIAVSKYPMYFLVLEFSILKKTYLIFYIAIKIFYR